MINKKLEDKINEELEIPKIYYDRPNKDFINQVKRWIEEDKQIYFYHNSKWLKLRQEVLHAYHNECVLCKMDGKITNKSKSNRSLECHHMYELELYPEYCLSPIIIDPITGKKIANIIPLCTAHHLQIHNKERFLNQNKKEKFKNIERW